MKNTLFNFGLALFGLAVFVFGEAHAQTAEARPIPQWLLDDWALRTEGTGVWVTDNSAYQSEEEPFGAYGIKWEYGLGQKHLRGRLYCIQNGEDVATLWAFTEFWDPHLGEARLLQIGGDGTVGQGKAWPIDDGSHKSQQLFTSPDGSSFGAGHHAWTVDGKQHTQSFNIVEGEWVERRYYVWERGEEVLKK